MKDPRSKVHDKASDIHAREKPALDTFTVRTRRFGPDTTFLYVPIEDSNRQGSWLR